MLFILGLLAGLPIGVIASVFAWRYIELATEPKLTVSTVPPDYPRSKGHLPSESPHEFFHVMVRHADAYPPFSSRRAAWSSRATIEVFKEGEPRRFIDDIVEARWPSRPQPIKDVALGGRLVTILDQALLFVGRYNDVHFHESRRNRVLLDALVKFEGEEDCYLFSNESYTASRWQKPEWRLPPGNYRLRYTVFYEIGEVKAVFLLQNGGSRRDDVLLSATDVDVVVEE